MKHYKTVSIGEASRLCNISVRRIRYLADHGYIPQPTRVVCGDISYRQFTQNDIAIIKQIKAFQDEGFTLKTAVNKAIQKRS